MAGYPRGHPQEPGHDLRERDHLETTRRFAHHGYLAICANLYEREGGGNDANPDDVGIADAQMAGEGNAR